MFEHNGTRIVSQPERTIAVAYYPRPDTVQPKRVNPVESLLFSLVSPNRPFITGCRLPSRIYFHRFAISSLRADVEYRLGARYEYRMFLCLDIGNRSIRPK